MRNPFTMAFQRLGIIPVFFLSIFQTIAGQVDFPDARSLALGSCNSICIYSSANQQNPAAYAKNNQFIISFEHAQPFLTKEIGVNTLAINLPSKNGFYNFKLNTYGINGFRQNSLQGGYGMQLAENIHAGVSFNFYNSNCSENFFYLWRLSFSLGTILTISDKTYIALLINNPVSINNFPAYRNSLSANISLGIAHEIYENTRFYSEFSYESLSGPQIKFGLNYQMKENFALQCGYHSGPTTVSIGSCLQHKKTNIQISAAWTNRLGIHPAFALSFNR